MIGILSWPARGQRRSAAALLLLLVGAPLSARAHDLQTKLREHPPFVELVATYEGTEAASFIAVTVYAPASANVKADAFQSGRTDYAGRFVFRPSAPGEWRLVVDDEMGHKTELRVSVDAAPTPEQATATGGLSTALRLLIGLSLILGCAGFLYGFTARKRGRNA